MRNRFYLFYISLFSSHLFYLCMGYTLGIHLSPTKAKAALHVAAKSCLDS